jgi:uncharacterized protein (DUF1800 family)
MDAAVRALNRYGLGARPGEARRLSDPRGWLRAQLRGDAPRVDSPPVAEAERIGDAIRTLRQAGRVDEAMRRQARRQLQDVTVAEQQQVLATRLSSDRPFVERLVAFWSNHLCVSVGSKVLVAPLAGSYEREAIRPHVLGRFEDMVWASARHPAMLAYLDNFQSIGPGSPAVALGRTGGRQRRAEQGAAARRGLNENYARELLELHTLGVDGGYTQQDVQELARMLTGWTIDGIAGAGRPPMRPRLGVRARARAQGPEGPLRFVFRNALHEPGSKTLLGRRYDEAGEAEGRRAIQALCAHPSAARFVARKLVTHFVSDSPPASAVDRVTERFRSSGGDLKAVAETLIELPEAWEEESRKFRTPQDWLVAVLRALGASQVPGNTAPLLRQLRQPLWSPPAPKGYGDSLQEWADPDSLLNRGELARTIARLPGVRDVAPGSLLDVVDPVGAEPLRPLLEDAAIARDERLALALAGPAFQWR